MLARGVRERVIHVREKTDGPVVRVDRYTPIDRLRRAAEMDRFGSEHTSIREGETSPRCRCHDCQAKGYDTVDFPGFRGWKAVPGQRNAYANDIAGALLYSIDKCDDICRKLYGQLTGHCGVCGRLIYDPESKRIGIGPDCRGTGDRRALDPAICGTETPPARK